MAANLKGSAVAKLLAEYEDEVESASIVEATRRHPDLLEEVLAIPSCATTTTISRSCARGADFYRMIMNRCCSSG